MSEVEIIKLIGEYFYHGICVPLVQLVILLVKLVCYLITDTIALVKSFDK